MTRYEELPVSDIADRLQLSVRTVENHLRMGRKDVRDFMRQCI
jgi:RNA polymerase sigma-70 factor (ECF subfamily)